MRPKDNPSDLILESSRVPEIVIGCHGVVEIDAYKKTETDTGYDLFNSLLSEAVLTNDIDVCKKALALIDTLKQVLLCSILNQRKLLEDTTLSPASLCTQKELDRLTDRANNLEVTKKAILCRLNEIELCDCSHQKNETGVKFRKTKNAIKIIYPNEFTTIVAIRPGVTLIQSLEKKFELYKDKGAKSGSKPNKLKPICLPSRIPIDWDTLLTDINAAEIIIEKQHESNHVLKRIAVFLPPVVCSMCHHLMFFGRRCCSCSFAIHARCSNIKSNRSSKLFSTPKSASYINNNNGDSLDDLCPQSSEINSSSDDNLILRNKRNTNSTGSQGSNGCDEESPMGTGQFFSTDSLRREDESNVLGFRMPDLLLPDWQPTEKICSSNPSSPKSMRSKLHFKGIHGASKESTFTSYHVQTANWEIAYDEIIRKERRIGSGSFGTVYEAELLNHGRVAIKELNISDPSHTKLEKFKNEVIALKKCRHRNIVSFLGYTSKPSLSIITEWCSGSSLYQYIHVNDQTLTTLIVTEMGKQICQGMCYLHSRDIIHRDLKSNNIFLQRENNEDLLVKIGDMGLATVKKSVCVNDRSLRHPTGSIQWMAPEIIRMEVEDPYTVQSDVYAFGIVLYELVAGRLPYSQLDLTRDQILFMVGSGRLSPSSGDARSGTPKLLHRYIERCCLGRILVYGTNVFRIVPINLTETSVVHSMRFCVV
ncbi:hypothetical protein ACOME3_005749 [Neoechinorhynchus agilis]